MRVHGVRVTVSSPGMASYNYVVDKMYVHRLLASEHLVRLAGQLGGAEKRRVSEGETVYCIELAPKAEGEPSHKLEMIEHTVVN